MKGSKNRAISVGGVCDGAKNSTLIEREVIISLHVEEVDDVLF